MAPRLQFDDFEPPAVALLASGGHSQIVHVQQWGEYETLGHTIDDAAGEAFDKLARAMGLGFPGGPAIDRASAPWKPAFSTTASESVDADEEYSPIPATIMYASGNSRMKRRIAK